MKTISKSFRLTSETVEALEELVEGGAAPTQTALIEQLIQRERARRKKVSEEQSLVMEWAQSMLDPAFVADQQEIEAAFASADLEASLDISLGCVGPSCGPR